MLLRALGVLSSAAVASALQLLPPISSPSNSTAAAKWDITATSKIYIDRAFASSRDAEGLSLIPSTALEFANTFRQDLSELTKSNWTIEIVEQLSNNSSLNGILLGSFTGDVSELTYENGNPSSEGYELVIKSNGAFIGGASARGMWWGTRTLLQMILLQDGPLVPGSIVDVPAYATRGFMLDAGRKWYSPSFLKELCTYGSFFKMSEFHYHLSDNYPLNRGHNETWQNVYSQFSLLPEDESLHGIIARKNETLSRADFEDFQAHCASRGVTVIPEIEAPGHCLYLTKWKPELALPKRDLLNLSHPETIPTVKSIWSEFLPWFETKEVHVGADEYDAALADDYINFVNEMSNFINETVGKKIRIWGTPEPSENVSISKDILIQHWQYGQSDPIQLVDGGYDIINSEDWWAYMSVKSDHMPILPAKYPQFFNESRVLNFANVQGWQWNPSDFNPVNKTMQLSPSTNHNKGAIMAAWNDNGPDASTQLEAYYSMRRGIALVGAKAWTGARGANITADTASESVDFYSALIPGANLERTIASNGSEPLLSWSRQSTDGDTITLGYGSKGMNYTLSLSAAGPFTLSGLDNTLSLDGDGNLVFTSDGWSYPLRSVSEPDALELDPGHPGRIWVNVSSSTHEPLKVETPIQITIATDVLGGSRVWLNASFAGRFEVFVFGGRNTQFSWNQMAFVAPLETISGDLESLVLEGAVQIPSGTNGTAPPIVSGDGVTAFPGTGAITAIAGLMALIYLM